ncbi:hypothetical protein HPP92_003659 [Vanilla planifolia]|uniref:Cyclin-dependent kinase inhibitor n=1 Tax=Vanilla planifolia TaxID=51239 RepID=A0A835VJL1_VANPL|nr:hypothetical protein HPP92_004111 [Vanilla planifolia]KAG0503587.1 hypothetical protein HPP92_003659 [Vanilla planifolia]
MRKYTRKRRKIAEVAVTEETQLVGVKTRARTLALASAAEMRRGEGCPKMAKAGDVRTAYLQLRSRSLVMTHPHSNGARNSLGKNYGSDGRGRISRCSSISSCEAVEVEGLRGSASGANEKCENHGSSTHFADRNGDWRDNKPSNNHSRETESTADRDLLQDCRPQLWIPSAAEIEQFFAKAEKSEKQRFTSKYNFDFDNEIPLAGRYKWIRMKP